MPITLRWNGSTTLPVHAEGLSPEALTGLSMVEVARLVIPVGNLDARLGDLFRIEGYGADGILIVEGDLRRLRGLGRGMTAGRLVVRGNAGPGLGAEMSGGTIEVFGSADVAAGVAMRGGLLHVKGCAGHRLGAAEAGSRLGMRGGLIVVEGDAGDDVGLAMRRGLIAILGRAGDGLGRGMIAGSIFEFGSVGLRPGAGMKRGTIALFTPEPPTVLPSFHASGRLRPPALNLMLRHLRSRSVPVPATAFQGPVTRYNGDLAARGQGEILAWSP